MGRIKILYLIEGLGIGGAEQLLLTTLKYLNRDKFSLVVYCIGKNGKIANEIEALDIKVTPLNEKMCLWNLGAVFGLLKIFREEKPYIVHTHLFYANYFGRIAAVLARIPVVIITEHGAHSSFKKFYHHWIDFILSLFSNKIIAVSDSVRRYLIEHSLIFNRKIKVIYNAVDFDKFERRIGQSNRLLMRRKLGFDQADFLIGCVSKLSACKGQHFLIEALCEIKKSFPQIKLCMVGWDTGSFQEQLENLAEAKGVIENVSFLGGRDDIPEILGAFDLFVLPSLSEGFGLSLIEAMYTGLPVVATRRDGILEIIDDRRDGLLVPPADSGALAARVIELLNDSNAREALGRNAKEKVEKLFSPVDYINKLESCYEDLLK